MARTERQMSTMQRPTRGHFFRPRRPHSVRTIVLGVIASILVAAVGAAILRVWLAAPTYDLDPKSLLLTQADVPASLMLDATGGVGPAQDTVSPLPYQQQMIGGLIRIYFARSVESPAGLKEINGWISKYGVPISNPPVIKGPFVTDHSGIFELDEVVRSFQTVDAARQEYHCCSYPGRATNFTDYRTLTVQLGDEADAWTGIQRPLSGPSISPAMPQDSKYEELGFSLHWRHGPVVTTLSIWGAHDITLDQALELARITDARIVQAMRQQHGTEANNATVDTHHVGWQMDGVSAYALPPSSLRAADRRTYHDFRRE